MDYAAMVVAICQAITSLSTLENTKISRMTAAQSAEYLEPSVQVATGIAQFTKSGQALFEHGLAQLQAQAKA